MKLVDTLADPKEWNMKALLLTAVSLATISASAAENLLSSPAAADRYVAQRAQQQQARIKALIQRGKYKDYESLEKAILDRSAFNFPAPRLQQTEALATRRARFQDITINETAINLAALGYDASDVAEYSKKNVNLLGVAHRLFSASATPQEQTMLADTIVIARAQKSTDSMPRQDGYLTSLPFEVLKSIKGSSQPGNTLSIPLKSGTNPDGTLVTITSEIHTTPGATYLLILSKNWYQQLVAESGLQPSSEASGSIFSVYELADNNALEHRSGDIVAGVPFKSITEVEDLVADAR